MGKVANAILDHNGEVIGVMPNFLQWKEITHQNLTKIHYVTTMYERKAKMLELADILLALPGGSGTMDEFFDVMTLLKLDTIRSQYVYIMLTTTMNFFNCNYSIW